MCPWEGLSPWQAWAIEMTAPGMELLTEMQNQFLMSELGLVEEDDYLAWVEDEVEVVAVQVEELVMVIEMAIVVINLVMETFDGAGEGGGGGRVPRNDQLL